jgi:hypothetical protein
MYLRQSTAGQSRTVGPFVDEADGFTLENGLTIANTDIRIKKNGAASAAKNSGGATADGSAGLYAVTWDATDTATEGELFYSIKVAGARVISGSYWVLSQANYDAADPLSSAVPGAYSAGTLGKVVGDNLDVAVSSRLAPTVASRTLDVTLTGAAGVDWANVESPGTVLNLSNTAVGSVAGAVASVTAAVTLTSGERTSVADALLDRNMSAGVDSGTDSTTTRTVRQALRRDRNREEIVAGTGTVYKEDDTTPSWTYTATTAAGNPLTAVNPT